MASATTLTKGDHILRSWMKEKSTWLANLRQAGFKPVIIGNGLSKYGNDGNLAKKGASDPIYLGLILVTESPWCPIDRKDGFPPLGEFQAGLQEWAWSDQGSHELLLKPFNTTLNIDGCYRASIIPRNSSTRINVSRLLEGSDVASANGKEAPTSILAVCCGNGADPEDATISRRSGSSVLTMKLGGQQKLWILSDLGGDDGFNEDAGAKVEREAKRDGNDSEIPVRAAGERADAAVKEEDSAASDLLQAKTRE